MKIRVPQAWRLAWSNHKVFQHIPVWNPIWKDVCVQSFVRQLRITSRTRCRSCLFPKASNLHEEHAAMDRRAAELQSPLPLHLVWKAGELLQSKACACSSWQRCSHVANGYDILGWWFTRYIVSQCTVIIHFRMNFQVVIHLRRNIFNYVKAHGEGYLPSSLRVLGCHLCQCQ